VVKVTSPVLKESSEEQSSVRLQQDCKKHKNQYDAKSQPFLDQMWTKRWDCLWSAQNLAVEGAA
jgi:hypothetical protein